MTDLKTLADTLRGLLGPGFGIGVADPKAPAAPLWPEEVPAVVKAVAKRRLEFAAGRQAARAAMANLGRSPAPIPMGADRAPVWPDGLVGSIAHCETACIAVVAHQDQIRAIGVDIESATHLPTDLWDTVCTPDECAWLNRQPASDRGILAKLIFSAKESVYKAQYPLTGQVIGFDEVEVSCKPGRSVFSAYLQRAARPIGWPDHLAGKYFIGDGLIISAIKLT